MPPITHIHKSRN